MRGLLVAVLALLALAPAARADDTIGSPLTAAPDIALPVPAPGGATVAPTTGSVTREPGVITRWRIRVGAQTGPVRLRVLRPINNDHQEIARTPEVTPAPNRTTAFPVRIPVQLLDRIALECCVASPLGDFFVNVPATADLWTPPIGDGQTVPNTLLQIPVVTSINADVEPDADGDAFGDETQDDCLAVAGVAPDGCPAPAPPPAAPRVNQPPVVRFRTPMSGTAVRARQLIELDVADDAGTPTVTLFDDDGTICTLTAAPYSCTWSPTGADVGRATLLASAVDSDGRSTLGIVRVTVARFEADLTRRVRGRRVSGRLVLPAAVERALGCRGEVTVRRGRRTRTVALKRNCTYSARVSRRGRVRTRFGGNPTVEPAT